MFINENNLKELPQADVIPPSLELDSAASVRGDNFIMEQEVWKPTYVFSEFYEISNLGNVRSNYCYSQGKTRKRETPLILRPSRTRQGYLVVRMGHGINPQPHFTIHRLKAIAFIPNPDNLPWVNHKDGDKRNNDLTNLEWCTPKHNIIHARDMGLTVAARGEKQGASKLKENQVIDIFMSKEKNKVLGEKYNVNQTTIRAIRNGSNWNWLTKNIKK